MKINEVITEIGSRWIDRRNHIDDKGILGEFKKEDK